MQKFLDKLTECFTRSGYSIEISTDMEEFIAWRGTTPDHILLVPTLDYRKSDQTNSRWIKVTDEKGNPAGCSAFKSFKTDNLHEHTDSGCLFYDIPLPEPLGIECEINVTGKCLYRGGMYLFPEHRKSGISWGLATYAQALAIQEGIDWIVGQAFIEIVERDIPYHTYGFETVDFQNRFKGFCHVKGDLKGGESFLYFLTCSRPFFINNVRCANERLILGRNKDLATIAAEIKDAHMTQERPRIAI
ncbi:MAG: hypothetical protein JKX94_09440 [Sneathiella sp.]|nr:hypothetical protein [Sneathiella sp.]